LDERIAELKSTTFAGQRLRRTQIAAIQHTVKTFPALSLRELAHTVCQHLHWHTRKGENRIQFCLNVLGELQALGIVSLPGTVTSKRRGPQRPITWTKQTEEPPAPIDDDLGQLTPISLRVVTDKPSIERWNEYVERHHYLGYKQPIGPSLRYFIVDRRGRELGCLMFAYAAKSLACRDAWIGWHGSAHKKHLELVVNNNRFLIFPWVKVKCLASKALSIAARQLAGDWQVRHGYRPVLMETFVDLSRFEATCYRAANWRYLGQTKGRTGSDNSAGKTRKAVYVYALTRNAKTILLNGHGAAPKTHRKAVPSIPKPLTPDDPFVHLWQHIIGTIIDVADEFDQQWQQRKRVLNTLLIMLFVFRLVFSNNRQGYAITIAELWAQCRTMGIELPQATPVAPSAFSTARAKLDEHVFKRLQTQILKHYVGAGTDSQWLGHRILAVDGSKMNLPRQLLRSGYRTPSHNAHYPQGLLSCLYLLKSKIPVDFDLVSHGDERKVARTHLASLREHDVVVYDRGYFSYAMLYAHAQRRIHPIFRLKNKANGVVDAFIDTQETDRIVEITPTQEARLALEQLYPGCVCRPISLRLVKYTVATTTYILGTTLFDRQRYSVAALSDAYHSRWGIEELYKISKQLMAIEDFHGQSERGVKQELFAHFVLMTLTRIFSNHSEDGFNPRSAGHAQPPTKANFKNCLMTVARNIEALVLHQANVLSEVINHIVASISRCRQKVRPGRSYARRSRKPIGKWKPPKPAKPIGTAITVTQ